MRNPSQIHQEIQRRVIDRVHKNYTRALQPALVRLSTLGVRANHLTTLAFLFGIAGSIFLFRNHAVFVVVMLLHLLLDVLDGSLARREGTTRFGSWFDYLSDRSITLVLLGTLLFYAEAQGISTMLVVLALATKLLHHLTHIASGRRGAVVYSRSLLVIALIFQAYTTGIILVVILSSLGILSQLIGALRR